MQLNGAELNAVPLNGAAALGQPAVTVEPIISVLWGARVLLGGVDISANLTGSLRIEREEGAATLADFVLSLDGGAVNPAAYIGKTVEVYYQHWSGSAWVEHLRFAGQVIRPQYSMQERLLSCDCSDRLQDAIEALTVAQVDMLAGGQWSADLFESPDGRSRWDYAQERMSTQPASLQKSVNGVLQVTPWAATAPAFVFPVGSVLDQSMDWIPVELSERVNVVELELDYRFIRLRQRHQSFAWQHPDIAGTSIDNGFCVWRHDDTELPDIATVTAACTGAGYQTIIDGAIWHRLPPSGVYCDPPAGWTNPYPDLLLGGQWTAARRWSQPVTEQYKLRIEAPASIAQAGEVIRRDSITAETESDREAEFEGATFTAPEADAVQDALGDWVVDLRDNPRLASAVTIGVSMARVQVLEAHRGNRLSFQLPTADTLGVRLEHTLRVEDVIAGQDVRCQAKLASLIDEWDFDTGEAITTMLLAVSQGGGAVDDPVSVPAIPASTPAGSVPVLITLPSQLGGRNTSPAYDPERLGFSGNYTQNDLDINAGLTLFPVDFKVQMPEIPADHQDEYLVVGAKTYRVAIPDDLLEL